MEDVRGFRFKMFGVGGGVGGSLVYLVFILAGY